uniref:DDE Tnp4 domain-containing protein n=1 Tax=Hucho hucho TaxID=62062 RepID=A0A4W5KWQ8_9TELE
MAFWHLIERPAAETKFIRVTSTNPSETSGTRRKPTLSSIDEFLFMTHLSLGLKQKDLAHRFSIHQSTVSRIIISWANFLYCLLGSARIWIPKKTIKAHLPPEFKDYPDTQVVIDCTELRCQTPSPLLLQSEGFSSYKSHCTFKGMLGMSPHGAVTLVSSLYAGSVSDKGIFKQSGIISLLTPDMAIMVDKGFLLDDIVPCKVYRPAFLSRRTQMPAHEIRETQSIARLRVHVERMIRRVKEHKLFDTVVPLTISGSINQLFAVACLLVNYQNRPLVSAWAKPV